MATLILNSTDAGAPVLSGTNGALCAVLDWALVQNGWAIEFTATNARIYRAGTGNRFRLHVRHDSAITSSAALALWRGCEGATSATAFTDAFPLVALSPDNFTSVMCSNTVSATARPYFIVLTPTFVALFVDYASTGLFTLSVFGDVPPVFSEDAYNTVCSADGTATLSSGTRFIGAAVSTTPTIAKLYWARSIDGSVKSTGGVLSASGTSLGVCTNTPAARGGFMNRVLREKIGLGCAGVQTGAPGNLGLPRRGWLPNVWSPLHSSIGTLTAGDTFTDTAYNAGALFKPIPSSATPWAIAEISDTWVAPSG